MREIKVLHKILIKSVPQMHKMRCHVLLDAVDSLLSGCFLTVTDLGRKLKRSARAKHNIKCMDRLLSNSHLQKERTSIYKTLCHTLCANLPRPVILVDWSDIVEQDRIMLIRAALVIDGRAIPLYESIYPLKKYNTPKAHKVFLSELKTLLPPHCVPIIVTDAGFRGPWFKAVEALGWYWLGRVRNCIHYRLQTRAKWRRTTDLYYRATKKMTYLGDAELGKKNPYPCHLYLYKKVSKKRKTNRSVMQYAKHSNNDVFIKQQSEPWLIASNLPSEIYSPKKIMHLYGTRMQIEEGFRDLKSDKFGFGLTISRSKNIERLNILLLIAALATLCLWWVGLYAEQQGWHRHFQANTIRKRRVLSIPFLALQVIQRPDYPIMLYDYEIIINALSKLIKQCNEV